MVDTRSLDYGSYNPCKVLLYFLLQTIKKAAAGELPAMSGLGRQMRCQP